MRKRKAMIMCSIAQNGDCLCWLLPKASGCATVYEPACEGPGAEDREVVGKRLVERDSPKVCLQCRECRRLLGRHTTKSLTQRSLFDEA